MILARRSFLTGLASALAAPAIVRAASLMPVKALPSPETLARWQSYGGGFSVYDDLTDVVRRAFVPRLQVQLYAASPLLTALQNGAFDE